jgi:hypothetical protein
VLGGDQEFAEKGGFGGTAEEGFFGGEANEIGIVVFLGDVGEDEMADAGIEAFGIGEEFADGVVGKMASSGEDALFDDPRIGADLEHVQIVIGFEDQAIGLTEMDAHMIGEVAEIGADGDFSAVGAEGEAHRVGCIVRNGEGVNVNVADGETLAGLDGFDAAKALAEGVRKNALQGIHGGFGDVEGGFPNAQDLRKAVAVVRVFVSDQDGVEAIDFAADGGEASKGFAFAETGVNEDAGGLGFEQREIARTAGGEDGDAKTDGDAPGKRDKKCATLKIMAERWEGVNVEAICAVEKARAREDGPPPPPGASGRRALLGDNYWEFDEGGVGWGVVDALGGFAIVGGFCPEDVGDEGLRIAVVEREPT